LKSLKKQIKISYLSKKGSMAYAAKSEKQEDNEELTKSSGMSGFWHQSMNTVTE
jgi:hypothetical protein